MSLYKHILSLSPYLISIRSIENVISIDVTFPAEWKLIKKLVDEKSVVEEESNDPNYRVFSFVCESSEENLNNIYNSILSVIKYNKEREEKDKLFQQKITELKQVFEKQNLEELKTLKFNLKSQLQSTKKTIDTDENES